MFEYIHRSVFLPLLCTLSASLLAAVLSLVLNDRFIDSAGFGWVVFLLIPFLIAVPLSALAVLAGLPSRGDTERRDVRSLGLSASILAAPTLGLLTWFCAFPVFGDHPGAIYGVALLGLCATAIGCFLAARSVVPRLFHDEVPRWGVLLFPILLLLLLPLAGSWLSSRPLGFREEPHTLMLCLDAAMWPIIDRMTEEGELPAFLRLQEEGIRFDLRSIEPTASPRVWTTIASGVGADRHGVYGMYATATDVKAPRLWDMVEQNGGSVGVYGWPVTWPPRPVNGFMIPSLFALGPGTYPAEFQFIRELAMREKGKRSRDVRSYLVYGVRCIQYGVRLSALREVAEVVMSHGDYLRNETAKRFLKLRMYSDLFLDLWERFDPTLATFYSNLIDVSCHGFWKYYEPEAFPEVTDAEVAKYGDTIPEAYRRIDRAIGRILRFAPEDLNVVVVSDHGARAVETSQGRMVRLVRTEQFLRTLNLGDLLLGINITSHVYLYPKDENGGFPEEAMHAIRSVVVAETGEPVFKLEPDRSGNLNLSVLTGPVLGGRHLLLADGRQVDWDQIIEQGHAERSGEHSLNAILLMKGPHVKRAERGGRVSILDVAPTVLYAMGYPIGEEMDGRVLREAFLPEYAEDHAPSYAEYETVEQGHGGDAVGSEENRKEILRSLGYLK